MGFQRKITKIDEIKGLKGGSGTVVMKHILHGAEEMCGKGRVFSHVVLNKDCEIGKHAHDGDCETYYILRGHGKYMMGDKMVDASAGDVLFCADGEDHSIKNESDEPLEMIALILYTK